MAFNSEIIWLDEEFEQSEPEYAYVDRWAGFYPKPEEYFAE